MKYLIFESRFVGPIERGEKCQTLRAAAHVAPGDMLSLRAWDGAPYRSKQVIIVPPVQVTAVTKVLVEATFPRMLDVTIDGRRLSPDETDSLAWRHGFTSAGEFAAHQLERGVHRANGWVICWSVDECVAREFRRRESREGGGA